MTVIEPRGGSGTPDATRLGRRTWAMVVTLTSSTFVMMLDISAVTVALPVIASDLGDTLHEATWTPSTAIPPTTARIDTVQASWPYEVTGGGRIWYLVDERRLVAWVTYAATVGDRLQPAGIYAVVTATGTGGPPGSWPSGSRSARATLGAWCAGRGGGW